MVPSGLGASGNYEIVVFGVLMMLLLHRASSGLAPVLARWTIRPRRRRVALEAPALPRRVQPSPGSSLLEVKKAAKRFGGLVAVNELSFDMRAGEILGFIGPNGAGKSTMFNLITGVLPADGGEIAVQGGRIHGPAAGKIPPRGVARTVQHANLVGAVTV